MDMFSHNWNMGIGWLIPLFIIGVIIYLIQHKEEPKKYNSAQDLLDKRYANGGIDTKEYIEMSKRIKHHTI
jgi:putative membrane protein